MSLIQQYYDYIDIHGYIYLGVMSSASTFITFVNSFLSLQTALCCLPIRLCIRYSIPRLFFLGRMSIYFPENK